ncbi:conserved hypothetical protein [Ricinus communis]|uniref:Uncharacterized protein n=1 Tax=Ricinus communis TaxID=3988 RepID=B9RYM1_RICCO|nr:conserved hypothetical protein [Ricinus communis]
MELISRRCYKFFVDGSFNANTGSGGFGVAVFDVDNLYVATLLSVITCFYP